MVLLNQYHYNSSGTGGGLVFDIAQIAIVVSPSPNRNLRNWMINEVCHKKLTVDTLEAL